MSKDDHFGFYFLTGLVAGSVLGLLLAPKTGKKMRKLVTDYLEEAGDYVVDKSEDLKKNSSDKMANLKEQIVEKFNAEKERVLQETKEIDETNSVEEPKKRKTKKRS